MLGPLSEPNLPKGTDHPKPWAVPSPAALLVVHARRSHLCGVAARQSGSLGVGMAVSIVTWVAGT